MTVIAFEGVDGSGKTSTAKALANLLKKGVYQKMPDEDIMKNLPKLKDDPLQRYEVYRRGNELSDRLIQKKVQKGKIVISDRYKYSPPAYWTVKVEKTLEIPEGVTDPDVIVYLNPPIRTIKRRLLNRGGIGQYESPEFLEKVKKQYVKILPWDNNDIVVLEIDNSDDDPQSIAKQVKTRFDLR